MDSPIERQIWKLENRVNFSRVFLDAIMDNSNSHCSRHSLCCCLIEPLAGLSLACTTHTYTQPNCPPPTKTRARKSSKVDFNNNHNDLSTPNNNAILPCLPVDTHQRRHTTTAQPALHSPYHQSSQSSQSSPHCPIAISIFSSFHNHHHPFHIQLTYSPSFHTSISYSIMSPPFRTHSHHPPSTIHHSQHRPFHSSSPFLPPSHLSQSPPLPSSSLFP